MRDECNAQRRCLRRQIKLALDVAGTTGERE
jgi:hypothetical protein